MTSFPFDEAASPKRHAPATVRNRDAILEVLRDVLPAGKTLEVASGTGEHAVHFATHLAHVAWQPTDPNADAIASIGAHRAEASAPNLREPIRLDVEDADWGHAADGLSAIVCINMVHIAPWSATLALFAKASEHLPAGAPLVLYGPYRFQGAFKATSNAEFDARLRADNAAWGVRDIDDLDAVAHRAGFVRERCIDMPANNHTLVYRR